MTPDEAEDVLGVPPGASLEEIERAFRKVARATHPDLLTADAPAEQVREASERFNRAQAARDLLRDELSRPAFAILSGPYAGTRVTRRSGARGDARPFADPADDLSSDSSHSSHSTRSPHPSTAAPRSRFAPADPPPPPRPDVDLSDLPDDPTTTLADLASDPARWAPPPPVDEREEVELSPLPEQSAEPVRPTGESYWMPPAADTAAPPLSEGAAAEDATVADWDGAEPAVSSWVPGIDEKMSTGEIAAQRAHHRRRRERVTIVLGAAIAAVGIVVGVLVAVNPQLFHQDPVPVTFPADRPQPADLGTGGDSAADDANSAMPFISTPVDTAGTSLCTVAGQCWAWSVSSESSCSDGTVVATVAFGADIGSEPTQHRKYKVDGLTPDTAATLTVQRWPGSPDYGQLEGLDCV